ncbi:MAG: archease [Bryobacterales bacterium]|nr:archease [Bryobacteraceae bacterium]MDW8129960.1 archease [Bryobacterales bacterium]
MFEVIEHTADIGFRVTAPGPGELFARAAEALVALGFETEPIEEREVCELAATGWDWESLLVNWLSEVLYVLDARRLLLKRVEVTQISPEAVSGRGYGEPWNAERHRAKLIIKGVTYHQLVVEQRPEGWYAQVILDT